MKIQVLTDNLVVPDLPAFFTGRTYEVGDELGNQLVERMQAIKIDESKPDAKENNESDDAAPAEKKTKRQPSN